VATELIIDWTRCQARGVCVDLLSRLLSTDDWGYPLGRDGTGRIEIDAQSHRDAQTAVRECPRLALRLNRAS